MHAFYNKVTDRARRALELANELSLHKRHSLVTNLHVLWGILEENKNVASSVLRNMKVDVDKLKNDIQTKLGEGCYLCNSDAVCYAEDAQKLICEAISIGLKSQKVIGCHHLLLAILVDDSNPAAQMLDRFEVTQELIDTYTGAVVKLY